MMTSDDVDGLIAFYRSLPSEDLRTRFFSASLPSRKIVERWVAAATTTGFAMIAAVPRPGECDAIVAEAGYSRMSDNATELAIVILPEWRGWLGSVLVAGVLDQAWREGIESVGADILATNRSMIRLALQFGATVTDEGDFQTLHLHIPTHYDIHPSMSVGPPDPTASLRSRTGRDVVDEVVRSVAPEIDLENRGADLALELGLDSIDVISILEGIAASSGISIPLRELPELMSLRALSDYIDAHGMAQRAR
jgi:acyl carrier protein/RimJ/RimL family protein N-acetyltransferase